MNKYWYVFSVLIIFFLVHPVIAQEELPEDREGGSVWEDIVSINGVPLFDEMIDLGVIQENVSWMDASIMGQDVLNATYHVYQTEQGTVVYMPDAVTLAHMAANPIESGFENASILADGDGIKLTVAGKILSGNGQDIINTVTNPYFQKAVQEAWSHPKDFFQDIINGKSPAFTGLGQSSINTILELLRHSAEDVNYYTALLVFENCENSPLGCPEQNELLDPEPTPLPTLAPTLAPPRGCPNSQVTTQAIEATITLIAPEYPLVIGQDPEKRGADIHIAVTVPPITYTYYERVPIFQEVCSTDPVTKEYTCKNVITDWRCEKRVRILPDPIQLLTATADLTQESHSWIESNLADSWYDAKVKQPTHNLIPGMVPINTFCTNRNFCYVNQLVEKIPFVDPGNYALGLNVVTTGTAVSFPREVSVEGVGKIWVTLTTLKEN